MATLEYSKRLSVTVPKTGFNYSFTLDSVTYLPLGKHPEMVRREYAETVGFDESELSEILDHQVCLSMLLEHLDVVLKEKTPEILGENYFNFTVSPELHFLHLF